MLTLRKVHKNNYLLHLWFMKNHHPPFLVWKIDLSVFSFWVVLRNSLPQNQTFRENVLTSQAFQDVDEFASSSEQIWRNVALHHLLSNRSSAWMGAVRMRVQTADKNITIIHKLSTPLQSINTIMWREKLSVCMIQIHHQCSYYHTHCSGQDTI